MRVSKFGKAGMHPVATLSPATETLKRGFCWPIGTQCHHGSARVLHTTRDAPRDTCLADFGENQRAGKCRQQILQRRFWLQKTCSFFPTSLRHSDLFRMPSRIHAFSHRARSVQLFRVVGLLLASAALPR